MYHYTRGLVVLLLVVAAVAQLDPGLPDPNPTVPGWFYGYSDAFNPQYQSFRSSNTLPSTADVTIIGGGWSGVSVAYFLSLYAPQLKVVLVEARGIAEGASGRNLGWMAPKDFEGIRAELEEYGTNAVKKEINFEQDVASDIFNLAFLNGWFDYTEIVKNGRVRIFRDAADWNNTVQDIAAYRSLGYNDVITYTAAQCNAMFGINNAVGCTKTLNAYKLRPPALIWKLLEKALDNSNNLNVQTNTPVTSVTNLNKPNPNTRLPFLLYPFDRAARFKVNTARGSISTNTIVYATNAWTGHLLDFMENGGSNQYSIWPALQYVIQSNIRSPTSTICLEFAPQQYGLQQRESGGWIVAQGFVPMTANDSHVPDPSVFQDSINFANTVYPDLHPNLNIAHKWVGIMGMSSDGFPYCGPIKGSGPDKLQSYQWISAGLTGHGNPRAFGLARALVKEMIFGDVENGFPAQYQTNLRPGFGQ